MGLAVSQIRLLTLTARKADCEEGISVDSIKKMALTREQSELSQTYYSKLQSPHIAYYSDGAYNDITYEYLMGYGSTWATIISGNYDLKSDNSVILTDYNGLVVLSEDYASAITAVLGSSVMDSNGRGGTFSTSDIPAMLAVLCEGVASEAYFEDVINGEDIETTYPATTINTLTGETITTSQTTTSTATTEKIQALVDFYYPIFQAAAANGWTTEYNKDIAANDDYVSDALVSGVFQLETVETDGNYEPDTSLTYYITCGLIEENTSSEVREEITAWYEAEKAIISEKEDWLDIDMDELSTELEAINTEIQSVQSFIDDAIESVFDWGSS